MTKPDPALQPPPARCLKCDALDQVGRPEAMRSSCRIPGQRLSEQCSWLNERRLTAKERQQ